MKKYHVATGDGKAYYGVGYESYREAEAVLKFSQKHDPQAHIVEEKYHFTNADRIRAMSDEELEVFLVNVDLDKAGSPFITEWGKWLKQPAEVDNG